MEDLVRVARVHTIDELPPLRRVAWRMSRSARPAYLSSRLRRHGGLASSHEAIRSYAAAPALAWNDRLTQAADVHSRDMQANDFFSHTGSNGSSFSQRIGAAGYAWSSAGENIAAGQSSINVVVDGWIDSDGHCANLMNPSFQHVGLACVSGSGSNSYRTYWTMELARPL
jgi:uncharacterized protein YkwD